MVGLYLLSDAELDDMDIGPGEKLTLISTVFWTLHITYTDIATSYVNGIQMMIVQMVVVSVLSGILAIMLEPQGWFFTHILLILPWILFVAVAEGVGFTLMALGQTYSPATHAALILSLEGVFASVFSFFVLGETLTYHELSGCALMLFATYIAKMGCSCGIGPNNPLVVYLSSLCGDSSVGTGNKLTPGNAYIFFNDLYHRLRVFVANIMHYSRDLFARWVDTVRKPKEDMSISTNSTVSAGMEASPSRPNGAQGLQLASLTPSSLPSQAMAQSSAGTQVSGKGRYHLNPNALLI